MKPPVSLEYVVVVALLASSTAVLSYTMPDPAFNLAALLLGIYALHLVSVRIVVRKYANAAPGKTARRSLVRCALPIATSMTSARTALAVGLPPAPRP